MEQAAESLSRSQAANDLAACSIGAMELPFGGKKIFRVLQVPLRSKPKESLR